ncbi:MAG: UDP-N-acetylglucosamine--N-acetylmuramyl-(pentapeptide) pyrophosphoryl-undecaprenol N-acetylglucosamine transferase [Promethearchaeota archaeon]
MGKSVLRSMQGIRAYFSPNGVALGHAGRCVPIAQQIQGYGGRVLFSTYGDAVDFVKAAMLPVVRGPAIRFEEMGDGTVAMLETAVKWPKHVYTFIRQLGNEIRLIRGFKTDVVISDSRLSPVFAAWGLNVPCVLLLHQLKMLIPHRTKLTPFKMKLKAFGEKIILYDTSLFWHRSDIILVPDFPPPFTIAKANLEIPQKLMKNVRLIGQVISKRPEQYPSREELKEQLGFDDRPLIFAAIAGTRLEKKQLTEILVDIFSRFPNDYQIAMTRGIPGKIDVPVMKRDNLKVYDWVSDRYKLLKAADLVVSRAGHNTIAECMYYGKPMILIPTPAHTEHQSNAESVERLKFGEVIQQQDLTFEMLMNGLKSLMDNVEVKRSISRIQKKILKLNAVNTVLETIVKLKG